MTIIAHAVTPVRLSRLVGRAALGTALLGALGLSCGARAAAVESTDTGNPVVDLKKIRVVESKAGVTISGNAGAVTPGGADVSVVNLTSGDDASTTADADGSFEVNIQGSPEDEYRVTATSKGGISKVVVSLPPTSSNTPRECLARTGSSVNRGSTTGPEPICPELHAEASCLAGEDLARADQACADDSDCVLLYANPTCIDACGRQVAVSSAGAELIGSGLESINTTICAEFNDSGCNFIPSPCPAPPERVAKCKEGLCVASANVTSRAGDSCDPRVGCGSAALTCVADNCDAMGTCREFGPGACLTIYRPVCGCEGLTYGNECYGNGAPIAYDGECVPLGGIDRGAATPKKGSTKLAELPNGDTLTIPEDYGFETLQGNDSLVGTLHGADGEEVFLFDGCGLWGPGVTGENGTEAAGVNVKFFYKSGEGQTSLVATFASRKTNFHFRKGVATEAALQIASTYTALGEPCSKER